MTLLCSYPSIDKRNKDDDSMFQTTETCASGLRGVLCKDVDFEYSKLDIPLVTKYLIDEAERRDLERERSIVREIVGRNDRRLEFFKTKTSAKELKQMLSHANVLVRNRNATKQQLVQLAVDNKIPIPGESPCEFESLESLAENFKYHDRNGNRLGYRKLDVSVRANDGGKRLSIQSDSVQSNGDTLATEDLDRALQGSEGGEVGSEGEQNGTSNIRTAVELSPVAIIPHLLAVGESPLHVSPYSEDRDKQSLMDLLLHQYNWTIEPSRRSKDSPRAFFKPGIRAK